MNFLKHHPLFASIMTVLVVVIALEALYLQFVLRPELATARNDVRERIDEIESLQRQKPAPDEQNLRLARADFAQNADVLSTMLRVLNVSGPDDLDFFKSEPPTSSDAWFEISQFVDRMTAEARKANVEIKPDERFGFSAYTFEGPDAPYIRNVYRQHRIIEYLLGKLFAARPAALLGVQREEPSPVTPVTPGAAATPASPAPAAARPAPGNTNTAGRAAPGEIFVIDPQVSARTPGYVDTMAFRVSFSGQTAALRGFMNALAAPEIPLVVRSVEVVEGNPAPDRSAPNQNARSPAPPRNPFGPAAASTAAPAVNSAAVPIVAENASVFTVTVELFEVKIRAPNNAAVAAASP